MVPDFMGFSDGQAMSVDGKGPNYTGSMKKNMMITQPMGTLYIDVYPTFGN